MNKDHMRYAVMVLMMFGLLACATLRSPDEPAPTNFPTPITPTDTATITPEPSATFTPSPEPTDTPQPTITPTIAPTSSDAPSPTPTPTIASPFGS